MATEFVMPKLGLTMEEGTITEWLQPSGTNVTAGMAVLRIETDKTETDIEAPGPGVLHHSGKPGETFECGAVVGWFLEADEEAPTQAGSVAAPAAPAVAAVSNPSAVAPALQRSTGRLFASPNARRLADQSGVALASVRGTGPNGRIVSEDLAGAPTSAPAVTAAPSAAVTAASSWTDTSQPSSLVLATHAARQLADLLGVDIALVAPDPRLGRATRDGVAAYVRSLLVQSASSPASTVAASTPALAALTQEPTLTKPLKGMRGTIARRMHESLTTMAQLSLFMDAELEAVVADRERRKKAGSAPGYTDYVIAAAARALQEHPVVNSQITADGVALLPAVHIGMAVALDDGLIVPVIHDTPSRSLDELGATTTRLAEACRAGSIGLEDLEGGTFSVSTLGAFGVNGFTPVINPPNTAILGVGQLRDDVVLLEDGTVSTRKRMTLSLTWDHRAFDGAPAAAFTRTVVELLNDPERLDC